MLTILVVSVTLCLESMLKMLSGSASDSPRTFGSSSAFIFFVNHSVFFIAELIFFNNAISKTKSHGSTVAFLLFIAFSVTVFIGAAYTLNSPFLRPSYINKNCADNAYQ